MHRTSFTVGMTLLAILCITFTVRAEHSVARQWNDETLEAIRNDYARPTIHARNLFHVSIAMYDAWAAYDDVADQYLHHERAATTDVAAARKEAISFAAYRVLQHRYAGSPGAATTMDAINLLMDNLELAHDKSYDNVVEDNPAALGNRIAAAVIAFGLADGANELGGYVNQWYAPINLPLVPDLPGNPDLVDPNRWQPLALVWFEDQGGNIILGGYPEFLSPEWGLVTPFAMTDDDKATYWRDGDPYVVYHDPGPPPAHNGVGDAYYKWGFEQVAMWSSHLDATDGVMIDISPKSIGNAALPDPSEYEAYYDRLNGGDWGTGHAVNPVTSQPYVKQTVPRGDYARILAEFWADGPDSETPPGHWYTLLNYVSDHPLVEKRLNGSGPVLANLEWDVKTYLAMGGAMHDCAIAAWGVKGWYDYIRPVSAIRYLCDLGQCTIEGIPSYHAGGINLVPGLIELVTAETTMTDARHEHLAGAEGKIALFAWIGHSAIQNPVTDVAGVGWILAEDWWPYQRPSFVTPPFAGYVSGHSTYSRAAAELMTLLTGSAYFPGGLGEFPCPMNEFLVFEDGPSVNVTLQWATYNDASDQCSLSRIWGGIHPGADDLPGRHMGKIIGPDAYDLAMRYYSGRISCPADTNGDRAVDVSDFVAVLLSWGPCAAPCSSACPGDMNGDCVINADDLIEVLVAWGPCIGP